MLETLYNEGPFRTRSVWVPNLGTTTKRAPLIVWKFNVLPDWNNRGIGQHKINTEVYNHTHDV